MPPVTGVCVTLFEPPLFQTYTEQRLSQELKKGKVVVDNRSGKLYSPKAVKELVTKAFRDGPSVSRKELEHHVGPDVIDFLLQSGELRLDKKKGRLWSLEESL